MNIRTIGATYSILVGIAMIGMWSMLLGTGQVSEISTEPVSLLFHLIAEFLTAVALILTGFGLLTNRKWGLRAYPVSMGMLLYAVLIALGYYAQKNEPAMAGMFACLAVLTTLFIGQISHLQNGGGS